MIESLSRVKLWVFKYGTPSLEPDNSFYESETQQRRNGLTISGTTAQNNFTIQCIPIERSWDVINVPTGNVEHMEKKIGGYGNIGSVESSPTARAYDFSKFKTLVFDIEAGSGVVGYSERAVSIPDEDEPPFQNVIKIRNSVVVTGTGKYKIDIRNVNSTNYICFGSTNYTYGSPKLIIKNIYFE